MKFYVASSITNRAKVQEVFGTLKTKGHEVTTDWTLTDEIPEDARDLKRDYTRSIAKRDFEGIRECDVFLLLSKPTEGRSMYVELGLAIAMYEAAGKPLVFVVGPDNDESVFYFHPAVQRVGTLEEALGRAMETKVRDAPSRSHEGRLEEYKALRTEMLEIIKHAVGSDLIIEFKGKMCSAYQSNQPNYAPVILNDKQVFRVSMTTQS